MKKRILVLSPGYIGSKVVKFLTNSGHEVFAAKIEITDAIAITAALNKYTPEVVLNCAGKKGYPNVDWCEDNKITTLNSNTIGPLILGQLCFSRNIHFVHLATGCIFYGQSPDPRGWKEYDYANPEAFYTRSKYAADLILSEFPNTAIIRLRMPIDSEPNSGNLIDKLVSYKKLIDIENSVTIVEDLIKAVAGVIEKAGTGIFHAVNPGVMRHKDLIALYEELVDPKHRNEWIKEEDLLGLGLVARTRSNNIMQNTRLPKLGVYMRPIQEALRDTIQKYAQELKSKS